MLKVRQCMIGETAWFRKLEGEYHYMGESHGAGDVVRLVFEEDGAPVALMTWAAVCYCLKWRMACRKAAEEHVLTQSALAASSKELWRRVSSEGMSAKDAAKALGIPANTASKVKRRIETMVAAVEAEFDDICTHEKGQTK